MTNAEYTDIVAILDRSGSMMSLKTDTEGGFNAFIEAQRKEQGTTKVTLVQFDTQYEVVYAGRAVKEVPPLRLDPRGATALLDAIGRTVVSTGERFEEMAEDDRPGTVVVIVLTDGLENSSKEWRRQEVFDLVKRQTNEYNWTFIFMGANQDAIQEGVRMGFDQGTSMTYETGNVAKAMGATTNLVGRLRAGGQGTYTAHEREEAVKSD